MPIVVLLIEITERRQKVWFWHMSPFLFWQGGEGVPVQVPPGMVQQPGNPEKVGMVVKYRVLLNEGRWSSTVRANKSRQGRTEVAG